MNIKTVLISIWFFIQAISYSQNKQILYGFNDIPQSTLQNPGLMPNNNWSFGIPLLSNISFQAGSTGVTAYDLFIEGADYETQLLKYTYLLDNKDFFTFNQQLEIFSGGFALGKGFKKDKYITFGMYVETDVIGYFPKDYAVLAIEGNAENLNRVFNFGDITARGEALSVLHVGYTKQLSDEFTYGIRAKLYSSLFNVTSTNNKGSFVTEETSNNNFNHVFSLALSAQTSGLTSDNNSEDDLSEIKKRLFFGGNLGFGIDLGVTYNLNERWTLSGSLLDIGFIRHTKDVENLIVSGYYEYEEPEPLFPEQSNLENLENTLDQLFDAKRVHGAYTTWRPLKFNSAISYAFNYNGYQGCNCIEDDEGFNNMIGAQLFMVTRPKGPTFELTGFYYKNIARFLKTKLTYTANSYTLSNLGLGLSFHFGSVNFYFLTDNLLSLSDVTKANSLSLQFGFNYINRKK